MISLTPRNQTIYRSKKLEEYVVLEHVEFLRVLNRQTPRDHVSECESGTGFLFPTKTDSVDLGILQLWAPGHQAYTCILTYNRFAWISRFERQFIPHLLTTDANHRLTLRIVIDQEVYYKHESNIHPIWITGEGSRGPHSFHYGHYSVDYLASIAFLRQTGSCLSDSFIQGAPTRWQQSIAKSASLSYSAYTLATPVDTNAFNIIHYVKCSVAFLAPTLDPDSRYYRYSALIDHCAGAYGLRYSRVCDRHLDSIRPMVFLSRAGMPNQRIHDESAVFDVFRSVFPRCALVRPDMMDPDNLFDWLDQICPVIVSAGNSALGPIMMYCKVAHPIIQIVPFTVEEIRRGRCDGYQTISNIRAGGMLLPISCNSGNTSNLSWNATMRPDPLSLLQVLGSLRDNPEAMDRVTELSVNSLV